MLQFNIEKALKLTREGKVQNKKDIVEYIESILNVGQSDLSIEEDVIYFIKLCLHNVSIDDLLFEVYDNEVLKKEINKIVFDYDSKVTEEKLENTFFSVCRILDSMRLDLSKENKSESWYKKQFNDSFMINKPYFKLAIQNHILHDDFVNLYTAYIMATSSGTTGGLQSVKDIDFINIDDRQEMMIKDTDVSYYKLFELLRHNEKLIELIEEETDIDAPLLFDIVIYSLDVLRISTKETFDDFKYIPHFSREKIIYKENIKDQKFKGKDNFFYESCIFENVDFSSQEVSHDFINCKFIDCDFTNTKPKDIAVFGRFPFIKAKFVDCTGLDDNLDLQEVM